MTGKPTPEKKPRILTAFALSIAVLFVLIPSASPAQQAPSEKTAAESAPRASAPAQVLPHLPPPGAGKTQRASTAHMRRAAASAAPDLLNPLFLPVVTYGSGGYVASSVAIADINGDGKPDIVVTNDSNCVSGRNCPTSGTVGVLLGNGDGTFQPVAIYDTGGYVTASVAIADVNGDGNLDLIVANQCTDKRCTQAGSMGFVELLLGNGNGTFRPGGSYSAGGDYPSSVAVADVNKDGKPDILVANVAGCAGCPASISVLLGNGDGTFQSPVPYSSGGYSSTFNALSLAVADLIGNGKLDLVVTNGCGTDDNCSGNGSLSVLLGNGDGTFQPAVSYSSAGLLPSSVVIADVNGDGRPDLLVANACYCGQDATVAVLMGNGDGTFQPAQTYDTGGLDTTSVAVADVNGDGWLDLLVGNHCSDPYCDSDSTVGVLLGNGDGTFQGVGTFDSGQDWTNAIAVADVNGDKRPDLITSNYFEVGVLLNNPQFVRMPTATTIASLLNPSVYGQGVPFMAQVTANSGTPTGTVVLLDGSAAVGSATLTNGSDSIIVSSLPVGANPILAAYQGVPNFSSSTSAPVSQIVTGATTATSLTSSQNPQDINLPVAFTASVMSQYGGAAAGSVVFLSGSQTLGSASLSGNRATLTTSFAIVGTYSISAIYSGDANNTGSTSPSFLQAVIAPHQFPTATTLASSLNPSTYGQSLTWTASVTTSGPIPPTGKVSFRWDSFSLGEGTLNSNGIATLTRFNLNADSYPLIAVYKGDANNAGSTSVVLNQVVTQATSTATLTSSPNPSTQGQAVTFTAKITSPTVTATGPVTFTAGKTVLGIAQLSNGKAEFTTSTLAVGSTTVTATYNGDSNIAGNSASLLQTVQP